MNARHRAFVEGYQEALSDIKKEWDQLGPEAALRWINSNLRASQRKVGTSDERQ